MEKIVIIGGEPLSGNITIGGSKNAILPIMATSILTDEPIHLTNVPNLKDIQTMIKVLESLGVKADISNLNQNKMTICYEELDKSIAEYDLVRKMRASVLILGPLLARKKTVFPGRSRWRQNRASHGVTRRTRSRFLF